MTRHTVAARALVLLVCAGCTRYEDSVSELRAPARESFEPVASVLQSNCGTLDCHGSPARNLRVYSAYGMRATGDCVPGDPDTTEADVDETYRSLIGVDPEGLARLARESHSNASGWIVTSKARGLERHAGGSRLPAGGHGDRCLVSWILGAIETDECNADVLGPTPRSGETW